MAFVPDSTTRGYLGPTTLTPFDDPFEDFLAAVVQGITDLDPTLVRPRWQVQPPLTPGLEVNWVSVGILRTEADWMPALVHQGADDGGLGTDLLQRHEHLLYLASFYGPNAEAYGAALRDGLFVEQNRAALRLNGVGLVEVSDIMRTPELFRAQYRPRADLEVHLNREVRRVYKVRNLVAAVVEVTAKGPYASDTVIRDIVVVGDITGVLPTTWDGRATSWDGNGTVWDLEA